VRYLFVLSLSLLSVAVMAQENPEGLFIHSKAPDFKSTDQNGNEIRLKDLRKQGAVVLLFYRGYWCPYCSKELKAFQDSLDLIKEKGATVVAITPEQADGVAKTVEKTGASFPIISDQDLAIMKDYKVNFEVDEKTIRRYQMGGIELLENNGKTNGANLPIPAVYVINKQGEVIYRFFNENYRKRPSVQEILDNIK